MRSVDGYEISLRRTIARAVPYSAVNKSRGGAVSTILTPSVKKKPFRVTICVTDS